MSEHFFKALKHYNEHETKVYVTNALNAADADPISLIRFFNKYISWNARFAGNMANLTGNISNARDLFIDADKKITVLNDRSNFVASYIFDTVSDEYGGRSPSHRSTHRCLAQAFIFGMLSYFQISNERVINEALELDYLDLHFANALADGFGVGQTSDEAIFNGIGFHLASESFGDSEYGIINSWLNRKHPDLVDFLKQQTVEINGQFHNCYTWISIHSSDGDGVEDVHFQTVLDGMRVALQFCTIPKDYAHNLISSGYHNFLSHHKSFFTKRPKKCITILSNMLKAIEFRFNNRVVK